jgi:ankyrin repeat protein
VYQGRNDEGHTAMVKLLLDAGAPVAAADIDGLTPLHEAVHAATNDEGCTAVVELLLAAGVPGQQAATAADVEGCTPLHYAARLGLPAAASALLAAGAAVSAEDEEGRTPLHHATKWLKNEERAQQPKCKVEGCMCAALGSFPDLQEYSDQRQEGYRATIQKLLEAGADACAGDDQRHTPFAFAGRHGSSTGVQLMLSASTRALPAEAIAAAQKEATKRKYAGMAAVLQAALDAASSGEALTRGAVQDTAAATPQNMQTQPQHQQQQQQQQQQHQRVPVHAPQRQQAQQQPNQPEPQREQQDAPGRLYSVADLLKKIKAEPGTDEAANDVDAADGGGGGGGGDGGGADGGSGLGRDTEAMTGQQPAAAAAAWGPQAQVLLERALVLWKSVPDARQREYFKLADQLFDGPELLKLYRDRLASMVTTRVISSSRSRTGTVRESTATIPLGYSSIQHHYPALAPGFHALVANLPKEQRQLLQQQQQRPQQQPAAKKRKLSSSNTAAAAAAAEAAAAVLEPTDAGRTLLLALRCLRLWESRGRASPQDQARPLLLQLLLFGGPAPADDDKDIAECIELLSDDEQELQEGADLVVTREVPPKQQQQAGGGSSGVEAGGDDGSTRDRGSGRARVKQEPAGVA